jgi:hypothetical protein
MISKLDHHVGKRVEAVDTEGAAWNIRLEDGTVITSHRKSVKPSVEQLTLMVVEAVKQEDTTTYKIHFGAANQNEEIVEVEKGHYEINGEDPHPQVESDIPPDPSAERVQDEPEGGWAAFEERESNGNATEEQLEDAEG